MNVIKTIFVNCLIFVITLLVGALFAEGLLRVKNANQQNYTIEMWRYSKLLKKRSDDIELGHEHVPNAKAKLQNVEISLNSFGMRGEEPALTDKKRKRILFLGSSNTLGWGVAEKDLMTSLIEEKLNGKAQVFNAGIGNYNTSRYVELFEKKLRTLKPDVIVVHYFINDAEVLEPGGGNWFLRNSELAVTLHQIIALSKKGSTGMSSLEEHYKNVYKENSEGFARMMAALSKVNDMSKEDGFKVIFAMTPEIHNLESYSFYFVHEKMKKVANNFGWEYVDFMDSMKDVKAPDLWAMPGDPHLNALGHKIMADSLLKYLK